MRDISRSDIELKTKLDLRIYGFMGNSGTLYIEFDSTFMFEPAVRSCEVFNRQLQWLSSIKKINRGNGSGSLLDGRTEKEEGPT